jgi:hypothetical protein
MLSRKRLLLLAVLFVLGVVLLPYFTSRALSPSRRIADRSESSIESKPHNDPTRLRICCYNIAHGRGLAKSNWEGGDEKERMAQWKDIAAELAEIDADARRVGE